MSRKSTFTVRLDPDLLERLERLSKSTGISVSTLASLSMTAAIRAAERSGNRLVVPIEFIVADEPKRRSGDPYHIEPSALPLNDTKTPPDKTP